jgi:hypothetical protein
MPDVPSSALPGLERVPGKQNWLEKLPAPMRAAWHRSIIYRAAKHMAAKGMPVGIAIASAKNWAQHICDTGDVKQWRGPQQVAPTSRAECCAAVALWGTMRATAKADTSIPAEERGLIDLTFELAEHFDLTEPPEEPRRRVREKLAALARAINLAFTPTELSS